MYQERKKGENLVELVTRRRVTSGNTVRVGGGRSQQNRQEPENSNGDRDQEDEPGNRMLAGLTEIPQDRGPNDTPNKGNEERPRTVVTVKRSREQNAQQDNNEEDDKNDHWPARKTFARSANCRLGLFVMCRFVVNIVRSKRVIHDYFFPCDEKLKNIYTSR